MLMTISKNLIVNELSSRRDKHLAKLRSQNVDEALLNTWSKSYEKLLEKHISTLA